jgi:uncharacterized membrane protein (UPF0127 family)
MNRKQVRIITTISLIIFMSAGCAKQKNQNVNHPSATSVSQAQTVTIRDATVAVEVADTQALQVQGLSGRKKLLDNTGMLFDFVATNDVGVKQFWMIDMQFNLDIIWIANNRIIGIDANVPAPLPGTPSTQLPRYRSPGAVEYVLEVNAGWSSEHNIRTGDTVQLNLKK